MKKLLLLLTVCLVCKASAQTIGPVEQRLTDSLCNSINRLDESRITTQEEAKNAFINCFMQQSAMFIDLAAEKKVSMEDQQAMHDLGVEIGKNLLKQKCPGFLTLAVKMAEKDDNNSSATVGNFRKIDLKGFNYIVLTDNNGNERSFLWLRQFQGSEKFMGNTLTLVGKKIKISWHELEVYLPQAKGYYKVKEITGIEFL